VYKNYVAAFEDYVSIPTQPPITRTNRLLRKEALPIFYQSTGFLVHLARDRSARLRFSDACMAFMFSLTEHDCALIRNLRFEISRVALVDVNISEDYSAYKLNVPSLASRMGLDEKMAKQELHAVKQGIEKVMEEIIRREGKVMLEKDDTHSFRAVLGKDDR